jgi:TldD protein
VLHQGVLGFAATVATSVDAVVALANRAIETARATAVATPHRVELADEPGHGHLTWVSPYTTDPMTVSQADKVALLAEWSHRLLARDGIDHVTAAVLAVTEDKHYGDLGGTTASQRRVRIHPVVEGLGVRADGHGFETMRTLAPPVGRGWEYLLGHGWDWDAELAALPDLLAEKLVAPSVEPGHYDLVLDPTNLWLTIHESVGHATELDRAMGYEAAYAGTSFATPDQLGTLRYGSPVMHVTGDRTTPHGLATVGLDDEGVEAQAFDLVRDGVLVGYQLDRATAAAAGQSRSNGCAFADSPLHVPIQRMANVSLQPADGEGPTTEELVGGVERGIYVVGDKSWSIDMQRYNFQFTGQRFFAISDGRLAGQVRDVAYQAITTEFWGAMEAVGGRSTYRLGGAFNCGKGQPGQVAPVSHGCPSVLVRNVRVLNTRAEAGR